MRALLGGGLVCCAALAWWLYGMAGGDPTFGLRAPAAAQDRPAVTGGSSQARAVAVEVATARAVRTSTDIRAIGSLQSDETVQLAPEIAGRVSEIDFVEGTSVKAGDVLVRLDDALAKAEVKDAEARLSFAEANNERARQLSRTGNVTERSRDEAVTNLETARAAVELAATRLDKHLLRAPFDGIAGVRKVSVGAFVAVGTPVVNIEKIDRLKVDFKVPEIHLNAVSPGQIVDVTVDAIPGRVFEGKIYAINPQVDVNGRALQARALIDNKDLMLRPGLFARILIKGAVQRDAVVVPESAILPRAGDNFVFRVNQGVARQLRVKLGERTAGQVEISEGLAAGDIVVTAGQHKLRDGTAVESVATHPQGDISAQDEAARSGG
ncbi:MAG: efflux RND transporter periplasmic adaptor subunit [Deltaproteobacteria bacterium]